MTKSTYPPRFRVRDPIKPGMFGYGRVPFALPLHRSRRHPHKTGQAKNSSTGEETLPSQPPSTELASEKQSPHMQPPELRTQPRSPSAETPRLGTAQTEMPPRTSSAPSHTGIPAPTFSFGDSRSFQGSPGPRMPTSQGSWSSPQGAERRPLSPVTRSQQSRRHWRPPGSLHRSPEGWLPLTRDSSPLWSLFAPSSPVPNCSGEREQLRACSQEVSCSPGFAVLLSLFPDLHPHLARLGPEGGSDFRAGALILFCGADQPVPNI